MSKSRLLLLNQLRRVTYHLNIIIVLLDLWVKETNLTLLKLKSFVHVDLPITPNLRCGEITKHFLASHFEQIGNGDGILTLLDKHTGISQVMLHSSLFDVIDFPHIVGQSL